MLVVIGANGFVGQEIVQQAMLAGLPVRGAGRGASRLWADAPYVDCDVATGRGLNEACRDAEAVIFAAGMAHRPPHEIDSDLYYQVNGLGCERVVKAAAESGARKVVILSSISVYGSPGGLTDETTPTHPEGPYGLSKKAGEDLALAAGEKYGIAVICLRLATVYGAFDPGNFVRLINTIERGRFVMFGNGKNRKTVIHRFDAALACIAAANHPTSSTGIYNLNEGIYSTASIVRQIALELHVRSFYPIIPTPLANLLVRLLSFGGIRTQAIGNSISRWMSDEAHDGTKFKRDFSWMPSFTLEQGIAEEISWYRKTKQ